MSDPMNPDHYRKHASGMQPIDLIEVLPFCLGNAIKCIWRAGHKGSRIEDLNKSLWYLKRECQRAIKGPAAAPNPGRERCGSISIPYWVPDVARRAADVDPESLLHAVLHILFDGFSVVTIDKLERAMERIGEEVKRG